MSGVWFAFGAQRPCFGSRTPRLNGRLQRLRSLTALPHADAEFGDRTRRRQPHGKRIVDNVSFGGNGPAFADEAEAKRQIILFDTRPDGSPPEASRP